MASSHLAGDVGDSAAKQTRRSIWSGVLAGVGLVAFIDETVFHQLLHWHHFYDKSRWLVGVDNCSTRGLIAMVAGLSCWPMRTAGAACPERWWAPAAGVWDQL
jgi:hypothetical protein